MFVCNLKINKKIFIKVFIGILAFIIICVFVIAAKKFHSSISTVRVNDSYVIDTIDITSSNYTSILKDSHENIDKYVGKKVKFVGFIYRLYDFNENQFVLAREMIISSDNHAVVVGFLCNSPSACNFKSGTWVEAEGIIEKGNYHVDLPVINVKALKEVSTPEDEYVFPPL